MSTFFPITFFPAMLDNIMEGLTVHFQEENPGWLSKPPHTLNCIGVH